MFDFIIIILLGIISFGIFFLFRKSKTDKTQSEGIKDLERRLTDLMTSQTKEARDSQSNISKAMNEQIFSFTKEAVQIREDLKKVQESVKSVSSFQDIFKAPKLRGQWGEASLEHILSQYFPQELYKIQYLFPSGEQVDAVLKLPNGMVLPIDSKFPSENFAKMAESPDEERNIFKKKFIDNVKTRISEIASKYVLPSEGTVDFALMYVPAEAIYYEIVNNLSREFDIANYAWSKKIILTSPNTIYLTLRTIEHWFRDTQISRQTQEILKRLEKVRQDSEKLSGNFRKLGNHLRDSMSAYDSSEKRLDLFSEKVEKLLSMPAPKQNLIKKGKRQK